MKIIKYSEMQVMVRVIGISLYFLKYRNLQDKLFTVHLSELELSGCPYSIISLIEHST